MTAAVPEAFPRVSAAIADHRASSGMDVELARVAVGEVHLVVHRQPAAQACGDTEMAALALLAMRCAGLSAVAAERDIALVEFAMNVQAAPVGATWTAAARITRHGRSIMTTRAEIVTGRADPCTHAVAGAAPLSGLDVREGGDAQDGAEAGEGIAIVQATLRIY
jgi:acyl-coenzyme A thioesterase PaaI-like protein